MENQLLPITVLCQYEDVGVQLEERSLGFLTGSNHAMYVEQMFGTLMIVKVEPTNDPSVYLTVSDTLELGRVEGRSKNAEVIEAAARMLHNMSAYEFMIKVMFNVEQEVDFENMIVPNLINDREGNIC